MNIVYSSDENYTMQTAVSIVSLLENNKDADEINVFILSNSITEQSQKKLEKLCDEYSRNIKFISFEPYIEKIQEKAKCPISISAYARLFVGEMLPENCDRVIYMDGDTVVADSLADLWNCDLKGCSVAGVLDTISVKTKEEIGFSENDKYINSGVLLIDVENWRKNNAEEKFIEFLDNNRGVVMFQDQSAVNKVLQNELLILPPNYNVMTTFVTLDYKRMKYIYNISEYYSEEEIKAAAANPKIYHFTSGFVGRAWETGCKHPQAELYKKYLDMTPYKGGIKKAKTGFKQAVLNNLALHAPIWLLKIIGI